MLYSALGSQFDVVPNKLRLNKALRNHGVYKLRDKTLILLKRSEELSFLFSREHWDLHGPVDYRVSHGNIYCRGQSTMWTDEDLYDTGLTEDPPNQWLVLERRKDN